jgi:hypothetical protein
MEEAIIHFLKENNYNYTKIENIDLLTNIHTLYTSNIPNPLDDRVANYYYGIYYAIQQNYELMKIHYLKSIEADYVPAMYKLAEYYRVVEPNEAEMEKYYIMGIKKNDYFCLEAFEKFYQETNYIKIVDLYTKIGNQERLTNTIIHYFNQSSSDKKTEKFILKTISKMEELDDNAPRFLKLIKNIKNRKIDLEELDVKYTSCGKGFSEAEEDFYQDIIK